VQVDLFGEEWTLCGRLTMTGGLKESGRPLLIMAMLVEAVRSRSFLTP
jgi:hypothetical protein